MVKIVVVVKRQHKVLDEERAQCKDFSLVSHEENLQWAQSDVRVRGSLAETHESNRILLPLLEFLES